MKFETIVPFLKFAKSGVQFVVSTFNQRPHLSSFAVRHKT